MRNTPEHDRSAGTWIKSSYSGNADNCLEITHDLAPLIPVRDSKTAPHGPKLVFRSEAWAAFVAAAGQ
ncbi:DUF397 domain-containing protein [Streptomyces sp. NPDC001068]|uniref:DUF397 domain-containing protein n=1 Tax=Streptomyces sp. NPDC001068 TaxID=3364544 RepID=UPI0036A60801